MFQKHPSSSSAVHFVLLFFGLLFFPPDLVDSSCETFRKGTDHKSSHISTPCAAAKLFLPRSIFESRLMTCFPPELLLGLPALLRCANNAVVIDVRRAALMYSDNCIKQNAASLGTLSHSKNSANLKPRSSNTLT